MIEKRMLYVNNNISSEGWTMPDTHKNLIKDLPYRTPEFSGPGMSYMHSGDFLKDNKNGIVFYILTISTQKEAEYIFMKYAKQYLGVYAGVNKNFTKMIISNDNYTFFNPVQRQKIAARAVQYLIWRTTF